MGCRRQRARLGRLPEHAQGAPQARQTPGSRDVAAVTSGAPASAESGCRLPLSPAPWGAQCVIWRRARQRFARHQPQTWAASGSGCDAGGSSALKASSLAGFGRLMQYPWATSQPRSVSSSRVALSSMPSATMRNPMRMAELDRRADEVQVAVALAADQALR